jgi:hypothetical protein
MNEQQAFTIDCIGDGITLTVLNADDSFSYVDITGATVSAVLELLLKLQRERIVIERANSQGIQHFVLLAREIGVIEGGQNE